MIKRKRVLINPKFQLKLGLYLALIFVISGIFYPFIIFDIFTIFTKAAQKDLPILGNEIAKYQWDLVITLVFWQIGFLLFIFVLSIFFTHRIAGPIVKATKAIDSLSTGNTLNAFQFRKGDYFPELALAISTLSKELEKKKLRHTSVIQNSVDLLCKIEAVPGPAQEMIVKNLISNLSYLSEEIE